MKRMPPTIDAATVVDLGGISDLLKSVDLPVAHLEENVSHFIVARRRGEIVGCVGYEGSRERCLLRSLAVRPDCQGEGIGRRLVEKMIARVRAAGMKEAVILTNSAAGFAARFGFAEISRCAVGGEMADAWEFRHHACDSAVCMRLDLGAV